MNGDKTAIHEALEEARARTWLLADGLSDDDLGQAATDFLSPPVWDLGHMANFEELWLVQNILECPEMRTGYNDIYDAFRHPRAERPKLRLLDREGVRAYMEEVRARSRRVLNEVELGPGCNDILRDGFVHWMLVLHEHQHQETLLQTIAMLGAGRYQRPNARPLPVPATVTPRWIEVPAGTFTMGRSQGPGIYDNEAPPHTVDVPAFAIRSHPVTNGEYLAFMEAGGYGDVWSERGEKWKAETPHHAPRHWRYVDGVWHRAGIGRTEPIADVANEILCHVSYFEAQAFARWSGARLPTEPEWEKAALGAAPSIEAANIDQLGFGPSRIGAYPAGASMVGAQQMLGDVWEWTSSAFEPYPGFEAFPYDEYSKVFFGGDYQVLRGGSWATRAPCATATFRNWDHPYRRQIFAGLRLARDLQPNA